MYHHKKPSLLDWTWAFLLVVDCYLFVVEIALLFPPRSILGCHYPLLIILFVAPARVATNVFLHILYTICNVCLFVNLIGRVHIRSIAKCNLEFALDSRMKNHQ